MSGGDGWCVFEDADAVDVFFCSAGTGTGTGTGVGTGVVADTARGVRPPVQDGEFRGFALRVLLVFLVGFLVVGVICGDVLLRRCHVVFFLFWEVCVHWGMC